MCIILLQGQGGLRALLLPLLCQVDAGEPRPGRPVAGGPWSAAALEGSSQRSCRSSSLAATAGSKVPTACQHQYVCKQPGRHLATGPEGHKGRCKASRRTLSHIHKTATSTKQPRPRKQPRLRKQPRPQSSHVHKAAGTREGQRSNQTGYRAGGTCVV